MTKTIKLTNHTKFEVIEKFCTENLLLLDLFQLSNVQKDNTT